MRRTLIPTLILTGCTLTPTRSELRNEWIGKTTPELIAASGSPGQVEQLDGGRVALTWAEQRWGNEYCEDMLDVLPVHRFCRVTYIAGRYDYLMRWSVEGNDCF